MTIPPTSRDGEKTPETRTAPDFSKFNVHDSFCNPITKTNASGEGRRHLSRQQLEAVLANLSERDIEVITSIQRCRYLLTNQLQRLYFSDASTPTAGLRAASRSLKKLRELGLIDHLARRIGGVRAGSGAMVWYLTHAGERLIYLHSRKLTPTKRFFEPSPYFLAHTLAVAEVAVQLTELCQDHCGMELSALQPEPDCWRNYSECGSILVLKPDLFAVTLSDRYEDRWFFEIDLDTESPVKVVEKCEKYHRYYRSGLEQKESEVFPLTVWIVPTAERRDRIIAHLRKAFEKQPKLFAVITKDELAHLIQHGGDGRMLC